MSVWRDHAIYPWYVAARTMHQAFWLGAFNSVFAVGLTTILILSAGNLGTGTWIAVAVGASGSTIAAILYWCTFAYFKSRSD